MINDDPKHLAAVVIGVSVISYDAVYQQASQESHLA